MKLAKNFKQTQTMCAPTFPSAWRYKGPILTPSTLTEYDQLDTAVDPSVEDDRLALPFADSHPFIPPDITNATTTTNELEQYENENSDSEFGYLLLQDLLDRQQKTRFGRYVWSSYGVVGIYVGVSTALSMGIVYMLEIMAKPYATAFQQRIMMQEMGGLLDEEMIASLWDAISLWCGELK